MEKWKSRGGRFLLGAGKYGVRQRELPLLGEVRREGFKKRTELSCLRSFSVR